MKNKKQNNKMKTISLFVIIFAMIIYLSAFVNAFVYDELNELKTKNCNLIERDFVSGNLRTELINKFNLIQGYYDSNCQFVLDSLPYSLETSNEIFYPDTEYGELEHITGGYLTVVDNQIVTQKEYLFILAKNSSALNDMVNFTINYDKYQKFLRNNQGGVIIYEKDDLNYTDSVYQNFTPNDCSDNVMNSIYIGNSGSYENESEVVVSFASSCINEEWISYPYCEEEAFQQILYPCKCIEGKCIATPLDIFNSMNFFNFYLAPGNRKIDSNFLNAAIKSWIEN